MSGQAITGADFKGDDMTEHITIEQMIEQIEGEIATVFRSYAEVDGVIRDETAAESTIILEAVLANLERQAAGAPPEHIELEPHVNQHGYLILRDVESKRPLAYQEQIDIEVINPNEQVQTATFKVWIEPSARRKTNTAGKEKIREQFSRVPWIDPVKDNDLCGICPEAHRADASELRLDRSASYQQWYDSLPDEYRSARLDLCPAPLWAGEPTVERQMEYAEMAGYQAVAEGKGLGDNPYCPIPIATLTEPTRRGAWAAGWLRGFQDAVWDKAYQVMLRS